MVERHKPKSKVLDRRQLFGPPPILEGEDARSYTELLDGLYRDAKPAGTLAEFWVHDLACVAWNVKRLRQVQAAFLTAKISERADEKAESRALEEAESLEGPEQEEMNRLLDNDFENDWDQRTADNPRAHKKYLDLYDSAYASLDMDAIQAEILTEELETFERIQYLIAIEERRFDAIVREMDRHDIIQDRVKVIDARPVA